MDTKSKINIAIADDHTIMRSGLAELIKTLGNYEVVIQASNGKELLSVIIRASSSTSLRLVIPKSGNP